MTTDHLPQLRQVCLSLPEVEERMSHGEPAWFVSEQKQFVTYADHHHDDRVAFWCAAPVGARRMLVESDPDPFFVPPYVGGRGWVGCYPGGPVDWHHLDDVVLEAYLTVAPACLAAEVTRDRPRSLPLEGGAGPQGSALRQRSRRDGERSHDPGRTRP